MANTWNPPTLTEQQASTLFDVAPLDDGSYIGYNPAKQSHPAWTGNNKSRTGFLFNPYFHPMGKYLQGKLKGSMMKCIDFVHSGLLRYDSQAFCYDDRRLQQIEATAKESIHELFFDNAEYRDIGDGERKISMMLKVLDIALFLMKEDIAYRWRFIMLLQRLGSVTASMQPEGDELTNLEQLKRKQS